MATRQPRKKKIMKFGESLGQGTEKRSRRPKKRSSDEKKHEKDEQENEDHLHDKICVLCCEEIEYFAKGACDHVVCFKCSTRMRVLCEQMYCAVCRLELNKVFLMENNIPFAEVKSKEFPLTAKYGMIFQNEQIKQKYHDLLKNICPLCDEVKANFDELKRHVRHKHEKQYCDICVKNLKNFPKEFLVYTRSQIVVHRKTGDADNKSYKGHPNCDFCSERYFDNDALLLHLRKNHFWCHFCEKDGKQEYYHNYDDLRSHFRNEHYLCEESECAHEKYTSVFRSDIDFQAHKLSKHSKKLSNTAAKQARKVRVDLDFGTRRTYKQQFTGDEYPRDQERTKPRQRARDNKTRLELSSAAARNGVTRTGADRTNPSEDSTDNAKAGTSPLNPDAPVFLPVNEDKGSRNQEPSDAEGGSQATPDSNQEPTESQYSQDLSTRFGAKSKVPQPDLQSFTKVSGKKSKTKKKMQTGSEKSGNHATPPEALSEYANSAPPGISKELEKTVKLPPGIRLDSNTSTPAIPPGLVQPGDGTSKAYSKSIGFEIQTKENAGSVQERNASLVSLIRMLINENDFSKFRDLSGSFRRSDIDAGNYYRFLRHTFGNRLELVFNELVDLLPDKTKQKELRGIHTNFQSFPAPSWTEEPSRIASSRAPTTELNSAWKSSAPTSQPSKTGLAEQVAVKKKQADTSKGLDSRELSQISTKKKEKDSLVCSISKFPISKKELGSRMVNHAEADFPALPTSNQPAKSGSWNKRRPQVPVRNAWGKNM